MGKDTNIIENLTPEQEQVIMQGGDAPEIEEKKPQDDKVEKTQVPDSEKKDEEIPESSGIKKDEGDPETEPDKGKTEGDEDTEEPKTPSDKEKSEPSKDVKPTDEEVSENLEKELDKPYGQEDLSGYSVRERALFFEMRRERRKRQTVQTELDVQRKNNLTAKVKEDNLEEDVDDDLFKDRDGDEFLTVDDFKKIAAKRAPAKTDPKGGDINSKLVFRNWTLEGQVKYPDFLDVTDQYNELLSEDLNAQEELKQTAMRGGNAAITAYNLVKAHPRFKAPVKTEVDIEKETEQKANKERAKRIKANENKTRTTGGSGSGSAPSGEYTLAELNNMSDEDFAKIPPDKRDRALRKLEGL